MGKKKRRDAIKGASHEEWYVYDDNDKDKAESEESVANLRQKVKDKKGKPAESSDLDLLKKIAKGKR